VTTIRGARFQTTRLLLALLCPAVVGCAADNAMGRLRAASLHLMAQPQAVIRSDFSSENLSPDELLKVKPTSPGSVVLRDALVADAGVREFVKEHGIPDGVSIANQGLDFELMYADTSTVYSFKLGYLMAATQVGSRALTYVERTNISPQGHWRRVANNLRVYVEDSVRLLRIGRRLLRAVPRQGDATRDLGFFVVGATPGSAQLFGVAEDTRGVIVAFVDPEGPAAGIVERGDVLTAVEDHALVEIKDYRLDKAIERSERVRFTRRRGETESSIEITPEALPFSLETYVLDTWEVNAFAAPGLVVFTTGLLNFCNDDELAFVFGHELGHIVQTEETRKILEALHKGGMALGVIAPAETAALLSRLILSNLANWGKSSTYRQGQELLADRHGIEYAAHAGFKPAAAIGLFEKLARREDAQEVREFIRIHPPAAERLQQAHKLIDELPGA